MRAKKEEYSTGGKFIESFLFEPAAAGMSVTDVHRGKGMLQVAVGSTSLQQVRLSLSLI